MFGMCYVVGYLVWVADGFLNLVEGEDRQFGRRRCILSGLLWEYQYLNNRTE